MAWVGGASRLCSGEEPGLAEIGEHDSGRVPREQRRLKGHLPRVIYHQVPHRIGEHDSERVPREQTILRGHLPRVMSQGTPNQSHISSSILVYEGEEAAEGGCKAHGCWIYGSAGYGSGDLLDRTLHSLLSVPERCDVRSVLWRPPSEERERGGHFLTTSWSESTLPS